MNSKVEKVPPDLQPSFNNESSSSSSSGNVVADIGKRPLSRSFSSGSGEALSSVSSINNEFKENKIKRNDSQRSLRSRKKVPSIKCNDPQGGIKGGLIHFIERNSSLKNIKKLAITSNRSQSQDTFSMLPRPDNLVFALGKTIKMKNK